MPSIYGQSSTDKQLANLGASGKQKLEWVIKNNNKFYLSAGCIRDVHLTHHPSEVNIKISIFLQTFSRQCRNVDQERVHLREKARLQLKKSGSTCQP